MKKSFLIIASLFLLSIGIKSSSAQVYQSMLGDSTGWYINYYYIFFNTDYYWASEDTVMDGKSYKIMNGFHYNRNTYLREDTLSRQVFYRQKQGYKANEDVLIYDFGMQVGDSMLLYNPNSTLLDSVGFFVLDSIVSENLLADSRRIFYLSKSDGSDRARWIEGIGSTTIVNSSSGIADTTFELTCFFKDGLHIYASGRYQEYGECELEKFISVEELTDKESPELYPNPALDVLHINTEEPGTFDFRIYNNQGQLCLSGTLKSRKESINVKQLPSGVYIIQLNRGDDVFHSRFVKQAD